jgi:hypothetical protein
MIIAFINNAALLITLSVFYGIFIRLRRNNETLASILTGTWFGLIAVAGMLMPFVYKPGVIFDGRSIVLALAGVKKIVFSWQIIIRIKYITVISS